MMDPWAPPPDLWRGRTVAIMAGGLSLTAAVIERVRRSSWGSVVINTGFRKVPWAEVLYAADGPWWAEYQAEVRATFRGLKVLSQKFQTFEGVHYYPALTNATCDGGGNGALHAALLAKDAGAARVLLFGVDLRDDQLERHYGEHPGRHMNRLPTAADFLRARRAWARCAPLLAGIEVINCNPDSALTTFPRVPLEAIA